MNILTRIKNSIILLGMNFLSAFPSLKSDEIYKHLKANKKAWEQNYKGTFISNQSSLSYLCYGSEKTLWQKWIAKDTPLTAAFNACELIAIQNALIILGIDRDASAFPKLITHFEKKGIVLSGYFGTAPKAIKKYLLSRNVVVEKLAPTFENIGSTALQIVMYQNTKKLKDGIHTICVVGKKEGAPLYINGKPTEDSVPLLIYNIHK